MKPQTGSTTTIILVLLLGCALGALGCFLLTDSSAAAAAVEQELRARIRQLEDQARWRAAVSVSKTNTVERTLRKRIRQLEAELAAAPAPTNAPTEGVIQPLPARGEFRSPSLYERMKNFKENDPKKYEHMRQQAAQHRQMWLQRTQGRLDYLSSLDTSGMTASERANHEKLQELLAQREKLPVLDPTEVSEEEMRAAWRESMQLEDEIRKASAAERETLFRQTAAALGLEGEDAQALTETIREVIEVTGGNQGGPRRPRGGRPPAPPQGN